MLNQSYLLSTVGFANFSKKKLFISDSFSTNIYSLFLA